MFTCGPNIIVSGQTGVVHATWNPSDKGAGITLSNGNLTSAPNSGSWASARATKSDSSSKRYFELHLDVVDSNNGGLIVGIGDASATLTSFCGSDSHGWAWQPTVPNKYHSGVGVGYGGACVVGDVVGILLDIAGGNITFYKNGTSQGVAYSGIAAGTYFPMVSGIIVGATPSQTARFSSASWTNAPGVGEVEW